MKLVQIYIQKVSFNCNRNNVFDSWKSRCLLSTQFCPAMGQTGCTVAWHKGTDDSNFMVVIAPLIKWSQKARKRQCYKMKHNLNKLNPSIVGENFCYSPFSTEVHLKASIISQMRLWQSSMLVWLTFTFSSQESILQKQFVSQGNLTWEPMISVALVQNLKKTKQQLTLFSFLVTTGHHYTVSRGDSFGKL